MCNHIYENVNILNEGTLNRNAFSSPAFCIVPLSPAQSLTFQTLNRTKSGGILLTSQHPSDALIPHLLRKQLALLGILTTMTQLTS